MYPVTGASGGAILNPWLRMPTQLVRREPCHSSCLCVCVCVCVCVCMCVCVCVCVCVVWQLSLRLAGQKQLVNNIPSPALGLKNLFAAILVLVYV